ncbi:hypothetical protein [Dipodfec virus UOA04_Rod_819]|nr:hypothetical protein [Dipodfec virus UOA04_Rod_819]
MKEIEVKQNPPQELMSMHESKAQATAYVNGLLYQERFDCVMRDYRLALVRCLTDLNSGHEIEGQSISEYMSFLRLQDHIVTTIRNIDEFLNLYSQLDIPTNKEVF